ncbi:MAG: hypothetical protein ABIQ30_04210 [Devosia sp.]
MGQNLWLIAGGVASISASLYIVNRFDLSRVPPMQALASAGKRLPMLAVIALVLVGGALIYFGMRPA